MNHHTKSHHAFRGLLQSEDGIITRVLKAGRRKIVFETAFGLRGPLIGLLKGQPEHLLFSERSRIARLGVQIESAPAAEARAVNGRAVLTLEASSVIPGYPGLDELKDFFSPGLQVGRLVYCDPEALLSSEEVLEAVERSELKLPNRRNFEVMLAWRACARLKSKAFLAPRTGSKTARTIPSPRCKLDGLINHDPDAVDS